MNFYFFTSNDRTVSEASLESFRSLTVYYGYGHDWLTVTVIMTVIFGFVLRGIRGYG